MRGLRIAFMGTPDFSSQVLTALIDAGHDIVCVYSQPPRPAGRGKNLTASPVHRLAESRSIEVRTPTSLKSEEVQTAFADLNLDVAIVVAYGLILPTAILEAPRFGCLNLHASLLPRWRGAAPIQRAIMAGDSEAGVAVMQMAEGLDTGDVLSESKVSISNQTTAGSLHEELAGAGATLIVETVSRLGDPSLVAAAQSNEGVTYAEKISKSEAAIDWSRSAEALCRHIHGLSPFPGAYCTHNGTRVKLLEVTVVKGAGEPGQVLDNDLTIACGKGALKLVLLQRAGKSPMPVKVFLNGHSIRKGEVLT
ncbi:MAG: methionyl-tRNA formyltransferase [Sneathiella sp.]|uniref:methionyl-tRNA formyltransferase n=1 Tax=Sneathiella sp. TaxID=1964365 RepID=UPI0030035EF5